VTKKNSKNFFVPQTLSKTLPNMNNEYILKNRWPNPPCMNIYVNGCQIRKNGEAGKYNAKCSNMNVSLRDIMSIIKALIMIIFFTAGGKFLILKISFLIHQWT
jgi:hypothetical protein